LAKNLFNIYFHIFSQYRIAFHARFSPAGMTARFSKGVTITRPPQKHLPAWSRAAPEDITP
jgi:hypothetical protein